MSNETRDAVLTPLQPVEAVTLTLTAAVLSVVAIVGNGVLIFVVVRTTALHTCTNFFIASFSAGGLLMGVFVIPYAGRSAMMGSWTFSVSVCRLVGFMGVLGPCVSALSLLVVSADRCMAICKPLRYASVVTRKSTVVIIGVVWAFSLLMGLLPLLSWGRYEYSGRFHMCLMRSSDGVLGRVPEVLVKEIFCVFIPVTLIVLVVLKTAQHVRGHRRVFVFVPVPVSATSLPAGSNDVNANKSRAKATRTLMVVSYCLHRLLPASGRR
ncbi:beta-1 adrenergic receptor-like [Babylonia areolata]|uniref:beta-1 adrenergic receptor-like n=1 Tax=Babylonia areolata TaxID=304850 RepID=UPI003FD5E1B0